MGLGCKRRLSLAIGVQKYGDEVFILAFGELSFQYLTDCWSISGRVFLSFFPFLRSWCGTAWLETSPTSVSCFFFPPLQAVEAQIFLLQSRELIILCRVIQAAEEPDLGCSLSSHERRCPFFLL